MDDSISAARNAISPDGPPPGRFAFSATALYAAGAALWIAVSDWGLALIIEDPLLAAAVGAMKGWAFVAVTSLLLFVLLQRAGGATRRVAPAHARAGDAGLMLAVAVLSGLVLLAGAVAAMAAANRHKAQAVAQLKTVTAFKASQISNWLGERRRDGEMLRSAAAFGDDLARWRRQGDEASRARVLNQLEDYRRTLGYRGIWLLGPDGDRLLGAGLDGQPVSAELRAAVRRAVSQGKVRFSEFYRVETARGDQVYLDVVVPLGALGSEPGLLVALRISPGDFLYPYILSWPLASETAETLLLREEGGELLFLSPPRHRPEALLRLRQPLSERERFAVRVVAGGSRLGEVVQGIDYRGAAVLGVGQAIAGTDWFLLAKADRSEMYAGLVSDAGWIVLADTLALFAIAFAAAFAHQRRELGRSRRAHAAQEEKMRTLRVLEAIADNATDAIYAKDASGRYLLINRQAASRLGKSAADIIGKDDTDILPAGEAAMIMANDRRVMAGGGVETIEETVSTVQGPKSFLSTKGALLDEAGKATGIFGISRDISRLNADEDALRSNEERWTLALDSAGHGVWEWDLVGGRVYFSRGWKALLGYREDEIGDHPEEWSSRLHPDDLGACLEHFERHLRGETATYRCEHRLCLKDGSYRWFLDCGQVVARDHRGRPLRVIGTRTDIGHYKRIEAERDELRRTVAANCA